ncbi:hypothetical protein [Azospirillum sp. TSA6c]|uniref:hypothetical protein n=1 Tax=unclassified Azospirillum TaxID=2630922 RepID=UPI0011B6BBE8|nr:hypothetical protein [Azospirillum sp. TSA6c]
MTTDSAKHNIVFIGTSAVGLSCVAASPHFRVVGALCMQSRLTEALQQVAVDHGLEIDTFEDKNGLRQLIERYPLATPFLIYQLDMIVPGDVALERPIFNLHRGNMLTNRGARPDVWAILEGHTNSRMSLHRINAKIDLGILIDYYEVLISDQDDTLSLKAKLEKGLPFLMESLHAFLTGYRQGTALTGGVYKPFVQEKDFTIDLIADSLQKIDRKIRSQRQYNGAVVINDSKKYYVLGIARHSLRAPGQDFYFRVDDVQIETCSQTHHLVLVRNPQPKYALPPAMLSSKSV